jgi:hypothetical protein
MAPLRQPMASARRHWRLTPSHSKTQQSSRRLKRHRLKPKAQ